MIHRSRNLLPYPPTQPPFLPSFLPPSLPSTSRFPPMYLSFSLPAQPRTLLFIYLFTYLSVRPGTCTLDPYIWKSTSLYSFLPSYLPTYLSPTLLFFFLTCLSFCRLFITRFPLLSLCVSVFYPGCAATHTAICLSLYLPIHSSRHTHFGSIFLPIYVSAYLSTHPPITLFLYLPISSSRNTPLYIS